MAPLARWPFDRKALAMTTTLHIALTIAAAAGLMRGFAGVGSGMLMAPFFVHLFGPIDTVAIIIMMDLVVTGQLLPSVRHEIDWRLVLPMGAAAALLMPLGGWLLVALDPAIIARIVAALVMLFSLALMTGLRYRGRKPLPVTLGVGALSGMLIALTSMGNPPVMLYLLSSRDRSAVNRANFTGYFGITLITLVTGMAAFGMITGTAVTTAAVLLPLFMLAAWIGSRLFRKSNEALYRRIALGLLFASGLYGLLR